MSNHWESPQIGTDQQTDYAQHENNSPVALKSHLQHHHHQQQHQQQQQQIQPSPSTPLTPPLTPASSSTDGLNSSPNPELSSSPVRLLASPSSQGSAAQNNGLKCVTNLGMLPLLRVNVPTVDLVDNPSDDPVVQQSAADIPQAFSNGYSPDRTTEKELQPGRFLLIKGVPRDASPGVLRDAFNQLGEIKGICVRFQEKRGIVILAFYDIRHTQCARNRLTSQLFFGNVNLEVRDIAVIELQKLLGQSTFLNESEGRILVSTEESKIDPKSLQAILNSFGDLRTFNQLAVPNQQAFIAEYFDSRSALSAINALDGRSMLGIRLRLVSVSSITHPYGQGHSRDDSNNNIEDIVLPSFLHNLSALPYGRVSQPTSPLTPISRLIPEGQHAHQQKQFQTMEAQQFDTTNSSPFHANRALPPLVHSTSSSSLNGRTQTARRVSTGSVNLAILHQSQSEQDLRRRAAAAAANSSMCGGDKIVEGVLGRVAFDVHARGLTSSVYAVDSEGGKGVNNAIQAIVQTSALRPRQRAISESSASPSPRLPSPADTNTGIDSSATLHNDNVAINLGVNGANTPVENEATYNSPPVHSFTSHHQHMNSPPVLDPLKIPDTPATPSTPIYVTSGNGTDTSSPPTPSMLTTPGPVYPSSPVFWRVDGANVLAPVPQMVPLPLSPMSPLTPVNGHMPHATLSPNQYGQGQFIPSAPDIRSLQYVSPEYSPRRLASTYDSFVQNGYGNIYNSHAYSQVHSPSTASSHNSSETAMIHTNVNRQSTIPASPGSGSGANVRDSADKNQIDLNKIAAGIDTRTTVMIKNIPNKLTDKDLIEFIGKVCPRKIDFLYLRMDFQNGCNVGYAFVNFIHVEDLLHFAKTKLGVKWNMFSSEKVLQMSYANYQGKEALVEKFKNSCVMDEREAWRPKIFYSAGPRQGLPEPFPSPTHLRRKERSSQNRGALYTPGPAHGGMNSNGMNGGLHHSQGSGVHSGRVLGSHSASLRKSSGHRGDNQY